MSSYNNQNQPQDAPPDQYMAPPPPPVGYPTKEEPGQGYPYSQSSTAPVKTKSRGAGLLKGCEVLSRCCCCCLDVCFQ